MTSPMRRSPLVFALLLEAALALAPGMHARPTPAHHASTAARTTLPRDEPDSQLLDDIRTQMAQHRARRRWLRRELQRAESPPKAVVTKLMHEYQQHEKTLRELEEKKVRLWRKGLATVRREWRSAGRAIRELQPWEDASQC